MAASTAFRSCGDRVARQMTITRADGITDTVTYNKGARFLIVLLVVNLHILRNYPPIGNAYLIAWTGITAMVCIDYYVARTRGVVRTQHNYLAVWLLVGLTGFVASLATISLTGSLYGLARFWFALPVYIALLAYTRDEQDLRKYIAWSVAFFAFAVATIPLQVALGPISWFREESLRGGFARYSSLLGGLNAAGGAAGAYILLAQSMRGAKRWFLTSVIVACVLIDLSKSGVVTIVAALVILLLLNVKRFLYLVLGCSTLLGVGFVLYRTLPVVQLRVETTLISFGMARGSGLRNSDLSVTESAWDRLTVLPMHNINSWVELGSPLKYFVGGGFGMGSTALVPAEDSLSPMAHNQYVEILTVFGVLGAGLLLFSLFGALFRLVKTQPGSGVSRGLRQLCMLAMALLLGRFLFANGALYHPASATPLFICMFVAGAKLRSPDVSRVVDLVRSPRGYDRRRLCAD